MRSETIGDLPEPLPYQRSMVEFLKAEEADLWNWFSSTKARGQQSEAVRLDLLKTTYRLEAATQPQLYASAGEVLTHYGFRAPITFYQAQSAGPMNAGLAYLPGEAHIVLVGPVLVALSEAELRALLAHELAHFVLYEGWDGEFLVAADLLRALANDVAAAPAHVESARLYTLYGEIFADRGAYCVTRDAAVTIATLIKTETGLTQVSADSYLRQADEIFDKSRVQADQLTHPEPYIRARALRLWADSGPDAAAKVEAMIEGKPLLMRLDLLAQRRVAATTRRLLERLLAPTWFRSEAVLAHARLFFEDFAPPGDNHAENDADTLADLDPALRDYYCYVLLDFVTADRDLTDPALAAAIVLSRRLGLAERFAELAIKELGVGKRAFAKIDRDAEALLARTNEATSTA
jgi:Peptidase family M48